ncbi:MAG: aminoacyl-histidine dipeptidase [Acidobacteriota bacterium]
MPSSLTELQPTGLWKYFAKILTIPHGSGNEKALGDYVVSVARELKLDVKRDKVGNVIVSKPAAAGHENAPGVILQGHLDMVCEKNSDVVHDFLRDPIQAEIKGDWVQAKGTTLGADNGIGLAASLAVMEDASLVHGPLEFVFTVDEETGLTGANKLQKGSLKGTRLLNLDSEEEGTFTIGCAGGADSEIAVPLARRKTASKNIYRLKISGLHGGHSGIDINQGRANAIKLLARMLKEALSSGGGFELVGMEGGSKRNAIPREAWATLACAPAGRKAVAASFKKSFAAIKIEYQAVEGDAKYSFEPAEETKALALTADGQRGLLNYLLAIPHGVMAMHPEIKGLVETSTNLAIIRTAKAQVEIICSTRSSVASALEATRLVLKAITEMAGARINAKNGYPGWMPNLQSPLLATLKSLYKAEFGVEATVAAIHAGLECGIIGEMFPGMDMISFGPTLEHPHSPDERVNIATVAKFWRFIISALAAMA